MLVMINRLLHSRDFDHNFIFPLKSNYSAVTNSESWVGLVSENIIGKGPLE